jgi:hypothetical protein
MLVAGDSSLAIEPVKQAMDLSACRTRPKAFVPKKNTEEPKNAYRRI